MNENIDMRLLIFSSLLICSSLSAQSVDFYTSGDNARLILEGEAEGDGDATILLQRSADANSALTIYSINNNEGLFSPISRTWRIGVD